MRPRPACFASGSGDAPPTPPPKTLDAADPEFVREVEFLSKLRHPNGACALLEEFSVTDCFATSDAPRPVLAVYAVVLDPQTMLISAFVS